MHPDARGGVFLWRSRGRMVASVRDLRRIRRRRLQSIFGLYMQEAYVENPLALARVHGRLCVPTNRAPA